jgi:hypothetical protein
VSLNLAQAFVRYPDITGAASTAASYLTSSVKERRASLRVVMAAAPGGWIGVYTEGNNSAPEFAQYLSRALEADSVWFGLAGRSLAYRIQRFKLGKRVEETTQPADLFGPGGPGVLSLYPDAEQEVFSRLGQAGIPEGYRFLHAEELGIKPLGTPDAVQIRVTADGTEEQPFAHRAPNPTPGIRTIFDRFDEAASIVEDDLLVRGAYDGERARALFGTLRRVHARKRPPTGWTFRFAVESPEGAPLLDPLLAQYGDEKKAGRAPFVLVRQQA